jgi:hypothetical protein
MRRPFLLALIVLANLPARADDPAAPDSLPLKGEALTAQVDQLKSELETLRVENAALKARLATAEKPATKPSSDLPAATFELGPTEKLGGYAYRAPLDWSATPVKDNKLGMIYRSQDKAAVILAQVRPKGAVLPEMQAKYAQNIIQMLKQDFVKNKTEVVEPPAAVPDARFFCKVHERIKVKNEKTADQSHLYAVQGKDMLEVTVITTSEASDQVASTQRLAEEVMLSFKAAQ